MEVFNLGTGNGYSVLEVIQSFEKIRGVKLNYKFVNRRAGDIEQVWADTTYANEELGWKAEKDIDDMMLSAWNWEKALRIKNLINYTIMKKILITGGAGFIGSHVIRLFVNKYPEL